ncbi:hypothetical protein Bca4012_057188 [Brassica carinata]
MIEILLRLPTKSIARCRCVSKYWSAILNRTDFTEFFMARSQARPQILFFFPKSDFFFFLTPHVQNKSPLVAKNHIKLPIGGSYQILGPVRGFVCLRIGTKETVLSTIYNLSTGQAIHLPNVKTSSNNFVKSYFGFDPIDKQFKVLSITTTQAGVSDEHQALTLGTPNLSWRTAVSMRPLINAIVGFDVKSKKLRIVNKAVDMVLWSGSTLVNYKGRLDAEKHEWSKHLYVLPPLWKNVVPESELYFVGMTGKDEIVLSKLYLSDPFYVYYYNIQGNTVTRVEIQGMGAFKNTRVHASLDHVEDVKLMQHV